MAKAARDRDATAPDPAVKRVMDAYHDGFVERHGFKPKPQYGRFGREVKELVATWGEEEVLATLREFFVTRDQFVLRGDWSLGDFLRAAQRLRVRSTGAGVADQRTAENLDAAARAMRDRNAP